eukprot:6616619-Prymnesium_polylepis.4
MSPPRRVYTQVDAAAMWSNVVQAADQDEACVNPAHRDDCAHVGVRGERCAPLSERCQAEVRPRATLHCLRTARRISHTPPSILRRRDVSGPSVPVPDATSSRARSGPFRHATASRARPG